MRVNILGVVAAIIAFISLALPWWTMSVSAGYLGTSYSISLYPWGAMVSGLPEYTPPFSMGLWFGYAALACISIAGILGLAGSVMLTKTGKILLFFAGILAMFAVIVFVLGFTTIPVLGSLIWFSGTFGGATVDTMLSYGFWVALVAAVLTFVSWFKYPMATPPTPAAPAASTQAV